MQRESSNKPGTATKVNPAPPEVTLESSAVWGQHASSSAKSADRPESPAAPPPVWTRYIDSRLKQFCTR
jgi:hypothetical protein